MRWSSFYGLIPFFLSAALALACALVFKLWHRRLRRRSPLQGRKSGHLPGQQLVDRVAHHHDEVMTGIMVMYLALPAMFMAWAGQYLPWQKLRWGGVEITFLAAALGMFGYGLYLYVKHYRARGNALDGLVAERVTGLQLNRLGAQGCLVLHDLPADGFNIDHVVVAPAAVYAVETKSFRKPRDTKDEQSHHVEFDGQKLAFPDFVTRAPIEQASRQAQWLRRMLRESIGKEFPVIPAVALPGWYIDRTESGKRADTRVFTPMGRGVEFMARGDERINATDRNLIAQALALRYPEIDD